MASNRRSALANYCAERNIILEWTGSTPDGRLLFTVYWPELSERTRRGFEGRLIADNPGAICDVIYKSLRKPDQHAILR